MTREETPGPWRTEMSTGERFTERSRFVPLPRRVLMTTDTVGGVWTYTMELARALAEHDVEIALATMGGELSKEQWAQADKLTNTGVFESRYKLEWMHDPWADVQKSGEWLLELEQQLRPDVVHLNGYTHGILPFRAPKLVVGHSCVISWWRAVKRERAPAEWDQYRRAVREGLRNADHVVAPSRAMLRDLETDYGPLPKADVVYNGRELSSANAPAFRRPPKEPIVFSAGRVWDEAKNVSALASVAKELPWQVVVAGEACDPSGRTHVMENVHWLGRLGADEVLPWFGRASIYAMPARYEPFGLSILEAALSHCALVLGDIPSLREIWGDHALFVDPTEPLKLKEAITKLIDSEEIRRDMAARARQRALELSPVNMAAGYLAVYSELMNKQHPEPEFICIS